MRSIRKVAHVAHAVLYRTYRVVYWTLRLIPRLILLLLRFVRACLWSLISWPRRFAPRVRYYYDVIRAGGWLWLVMQTIRRFHFAPFTIIDGFYFRVCRAMNLARPRSYSTVAIYGSDGSPVALRNFIIDLDRWHREDADLQRTRRLEVVVAGGKVEGGAFFQLAHLFPTVQDVHFYVTRDQLFIELPFFVPAPQRHGSVSSDWMIELDRYPSARVLEQFERGRAIDIPLPALGAWKSTQPFIHALLRSQTIAVINLPSSDGTYSSMRELWADFFTLVQQTGRPQAFMVIGAVQPVSQVDANPSGLTIFYASQLGMDLIDCLALVRQSDGYIGSFDAFGLMTVGSSVPALLVEPDVRPPTTPVATPRYLRSETGQILALDPLTPRQVFENYQRLMLDPRA